MCDSDKWSVKNKLKLLLSNARYNLLSVDVDPWKVRICSISYLFICVLPIFALCVCYFYEPTNKKFILHWLDVSFIWLFSEIQLIWFFDRTKTIPIYARYSFGFTIGISNLWFILYVANNIAA